MIDREDLALLSEAIDQLPDDAREVVILYYREGQSVAQVAALLGLSEAATKKRLSRTRETLRETVLEKVGDLLGRTAPVAAFTAETIALMPHHRTPTGHRSDRASSAQLVLRGSARRLFGVPPGHRAQRASGFSAPPGWRLVVGDGGRARFFSGSPEFGFVAMRLSA